MKTIRLGIRVSTALLAVALPFALAGVAAASTPPRDRTMLSLTVASPEGPADTVTLTCGPAGGTHPDAKAACAELRAVDGEFGALQDIQEPAACTMEYRPVIAVAEGTWRGEPVVWRGEYSNPCTLRTSTGPVFVF